jgi:drug/metabolite transporter (DMT)-like permease
MIDWHEVLEPLRVGMNQAFVTYFRDPSILIALIFSVPSLILGVVNAFIPRKKWFLWILGRVTGVCCFFTITGFAMCLIPHNEGLFFTRTQSIIATVILGLVLAFVIAIHKMKPRQAL